MAQHLQYNFQSGTKLINNFMTKQILNTIRKNSKITKTYQNKIHNKKL